MIQLAKDESHGYDQIYRWGEKGDYDCSSAVISAYQAAGVPVKDKGATYTGNMKSVFLKCGFSAVTSKVNLYSGAGLEAGDVLLNEKRHTAMYIGGGYEAEASINEKGTATGGKPGDQTGKEVLIRAYRNFPWDVVLRYTGETAAETAKKAAVIALTVRLQEISAGDIGASVKACQTLLRGIGLKGLDGENLEIDGEFGENTDFAVRAYQKMQNLEADGVVGEKTWSKLMGV